MRIRIAAPGTHHSQHWFVSMSMAFLSLAGSTTAQGARFIPMPPTYATGGVPQKVVVADMNKDGFADLLVSNDTGKLTLLAGKSGGAFAAAATVASFTGGAPDITVADFNRDGIPDLAVLVRSSATVSVYLGHGDGTFAAPTSTSTPALPAQIAVGDVNGDGYPDVVVTSATALSSLLGNGHGGLNAAINTADPSPESVLVLGDVNGDGRLDAIVCSGDINTEFLGLGNGRFAKTTTPVADNVYITSQLVLADIDGDGKLDLVVGAGSDSRILGEIKVSWGNGDGTFQIGLTLTAGTGESSIVVGDFNHDGRPDISSADSFSNSVSIFSNQGARKFGAPISYRTNKLAFLPTMAGMMAGGDFTGDGIPDLAISTLTGVQVFRTLAGGALLAQGAVQISGYGSALYAVPLNSDGHIDLAAESLGPFGFGSIVALYGNGAGQFPQHFNSIVNAFFGGLAVGDFNRDRMLDLAYLDTDNGIFTLLNTGAYGFTPGPSLPPFFAPVAGDFNNDGFSDLAVDDGSNIVLYINNGNATFTARGSSPVASMSGKMIAIDINKDGKRDLVFVDGQTSALFVLLGKGDGTFQPLRTSSVPFAPASITVGDFNRDGRLDVAVGGAASIDVLVGRGDGTFVDRATVPASTGTYSLLQTDLRHDGKEDLLWVDANLLWLAYGNGDGSFGVPQSFNVGPNPIALTVGDFNEDGAPDVAVSDNQSTTLALLLNGGGTRISLTSGAASIHAGQSATFTVTVTPSVAGMPVVTGTVALKDGSSGIAFAHLSNGKATFTTTALSPGTHTMTASYWETTSYNPHVSAPVTVTVLP
jgi:Bacterial Ig-like domain (group 3)/FG-GAP-like repeat